MRIPHRLFFIFPFLISCAAWGQTIENDQVPAGKLFGDMSIGLNDVEHGLTQTDKGPSLHAGFGYKWTQFRVRLFGENTRYTDSDDALLIKIVPAYRFIFTSKWDLTVSYQFRRSYKAGDHNDGIWDADMKIFDYHLDYQIDDQWEGTGTSASRIAVWRETPIPYNLLWRLEGGYDLVSTDRTGKYFDFKTALTYRYADVNYSLIGTDSTASGDFAGRGGIQIYLQISVLL